MLYIAGKWTLCDVCHHLVDMLHGTEDDPKGLALAAPILEMVVAPPSHFEGGLLEEER